MCVYWNGQRCTGVSRALVIWCCVDKPSIETFFHFKAPRGFSGHWLNGSWGRGVWGEQVQCMSGVIPAAICFLFRGLGSLNALWHASWRHTPPSQPCRVPRRHGTTIRINPRTCAESTVGVCLFCDWAWEGERVGGGGWGGGGRRRGWRAACVSVWKDTRQPFTFVKWSSGGEHEWSHVEGHHRRILITTKSDQSNFH